MLKRISIFFIIILLNNCVSKEEWSCKLREGKACKSISKIDSQETDDSAQKSKSTEAIVIDGLVERSNEKILTIYFAPFIDSKGNMHHSSDVDIVIAKPNWRFE